MTPAEGSRNVLIGLSYRGISLWQDGAEHEMSVYPWERIATVEYSRLVYTDSLLVTVKRGGEGSMLFTCYPPLLST